MKRLLFLPLIFVIATASASAGTPIYSTKVDRTLSDALDATGKWKRIFVSPGQEAQVRSDLGVTSSSSPAFTGTMTVTGGIVVGSTTARTTSNTFYGSITVSNNGAPGIVFEDQSQSTPKVGQISNEGNLTLQFLYDPYGSIIPGAKILLYSQLDFYTENTASGYICFLPRSVEKMRMTSAGDLGIGTTTPSVQLHTTAGVRFGGLGSGAVQSDANGVLSVSSDERLKIIVGTFTAGLSELMGVNPILHKYNELSGLDMENTYAGFSAQNVMQFIPEAVGLDPRNYYTLSDRPIVAALVNAVKELQKEIDALKGKTAMALTEYKIVPITSKDRLIKSKPLPSPTPMVTPTPP